MPERKESAEGAKQSQWRCVKCNRFLQVSLCLFCGDTVCENHIAEHYVEKNHAAEKVKGAAHAR